MQVFKNLYEYRELLKTNVKKELRGKYKGSFLGILWSFVNPLLMVMVYAIIFPFLMRGTIESFEHNYLVYLITGVIPWTFFTTVMQQGAICIRSNAGIIKKVYFPREILPISVTLSALINFLISCAIILAFCIIYSVGITWHIIFLPLVVLIQFLFSLGAIFIISAVNVYIKDLEYIISFILNMMFYAAPIVYLPSILGQYQNILYINPFTTMVNAYRDIFLFHQVPNMTMLGIVGVLSLLLTIIGYNIFNKLQKGFAEEV